MSHEIKFFQEIQREYQYQLNVLQDYYDTGNVNAYNVCSFFDRIHSFWRRRYESIKYRLISLCNKEDCMFFVGGMYPAIGDNDHFYFGALGEYHIVSDPFLKMEVFFRFDSPDINVVESIECLSRILFNSQKLLNLNAERLFILPVFSIAQENVKEYNETLMSYFWVFLSHLLGHSVSSNEDLIERYRTFESIEDAIDPDILETLIFTDWQDSKLTLEERIGRWYKENNKILYPEFDHPSKTFTFMLSMRVMQCVDFLGVCYAYNIMPYVEADLTFHYLLLMRGFLSSDSKLKVILEVAIIAYVFKRILASHIQKFPDFKDWYKLLHEKKILYAIKQEMILQGIDLIKCGPKAIEPIIEKEIIALISMIM